MKQFPPLRIPSDLEQLGIVRSFIEEAAASFQADPDSINDLVLAVDEAVTNIILHGYRRQKGQIEIEIQQAGSQITVTLRDQAPHFNPTEVNPPDLSLPLEKRPFGGLGVHLIRSCVDHISYQVDPQGNNELILVKNFHSSDRKK